MGKELWRWRDCLQQRRGVIIANASKLKCLHRIDLGGAFLRIGDPHMTGFRGQEFDFTGIDGEWYAVFSSPPSMHVNMRGKSATSA